MSLHEYFEGLNSLAVLTGKKYKGIQVPEKIKRAYQELNSDHLELIFRLCTQIKIRPESFYKAKPKELDEIEKIYKLFEQGINSPNPLDNQITRVRIDFKNNDPFILESHVVLTNLLCHSWPFLKPFLEKEFESYIKPNYVDRKKRKVKGAKTGKEKAIQKLCINILRYLRKETKMKTIVMGEFIISVFRAAGLQLEYKGGKDAYDALSKKLSAKKG